LPGFREKFGQPLAFQEQPEQSVLSAPSRRRQARRVKAIRWTRLALYATSFAHLLRK